MIVIANNAIPDKALTNLKKIARVIRLSSSGITYDAVSGHPDVFLCKLPDGDIIHARNLPSGLLKTFKKDNLKLIPGKLDVGLKYPQSAHFNAVVTNEFLIHNLNYTDPEILLHNKSKKHIHVNQAYTRCNLMPLNDDSFITSDKGIHKVLNKNNLNSVFVDPKGIILPGFEYGFIGGAAGVNNDKVYFIGSLDYFNDGSKIKSFTKELNLDIIELYNGPLFDGGSLIFSGLL